MYIHCACFIFIFRENYSNSNKYGFHKEIIYDFFFSIIFLLCGIFRRFPPENKKWRVHRQHLQTCRILFACIVRMRMQNAQVATK